MMDGERQANELPLQSISSPTYRLAYYPCLSAINWQLPGHYMIARGSNIAILRGRR